jgi:hypothetical protein
MTTTPLARRHAYLEFHTWGDFVDTAEHKPSALPEEHRHGLWQRNGSYAERAPRGQSADNKWYGHASWEQTLDLARKGWDDGEERVRKIARRLEVKVLHRIVREDINYDVEGMGFDVARFIQGEPEHWVHTEDVVTEGGGTRHVKVVLNGAVSGGVDQGIIITRGAVVTALVELLEYADIRCEVWAVFALASSSYHDRDRKPTCVYAIRVKPYDQPLDVSRVAMALAHPATFRRLGFCIQDSLDDPELVRLVGPRSYGLPVDFHLPDESIYIGRAYYSESQWESDAAAEVWILAQLAVQGVVLRDD